MTLDKTLGFEIAPLRSHLVKPQEEFTFCPLEPFRNLSFLFIRTFSYLIAEKFLELALKKYL